MSLLSAPRRALLLVVAICGCRTTPEPAGVALHGNEAPAAAKPSASGAASSSEARVRTPTPTADVTWTKPSAWSSEPNATGMRKATYRVPRASGDADDATVSVIQAGGTVDANVERWYGQFDAVHDQKRTQLRVGPLQVTVVEAHGTYTGGGVMVGESPAPKPGWGLLGAIVETAPQPYFFKMLGPDKTVGAAKSDFQALLDSLSPR